MCERSQGEAAPQTEVLNTVFFLVSEGLRLGGGSGYLVRGAAVHVAEGESGGLPSWGEGEGEGEGEV